MQLVRMIFAGAGLIGEGSQVPDVVLETTKGTVRLGDLRGKFVVLYFFPKAFTSGCTKELQKFKELYDEFVKLGAEVIGISVDSLETQRRFAEKYGAQFPLASDKDKSISTAFGVLNERGTSAQRITFIIDGQGVVRAIIKGVRRAEEHAERALEAVKTMASASS